MRDLGRMMMLAGGLLAAAGFLLSVGTRFGLGRLPGDFAYRRGNVGCYVPLMTSILLSLALSAILWFFNRR